MTIELSPYQRELLANLVDQDNIYRELKKFAKAEAIEQAQRDIQVSADERAFMARQAVEAGIPRRTVHEVGLHTTDAATLRKLLEG